MLYNIKQSPWWNAPPDKKFEAYYMNLRVNYHMTAIEAYNMAKKNFGMFPQFFINPIGTIREAINKER